MFNSIFVIVKIQRVDAGDGGAFLSRKNICVFDLRSNAEEFVSDMELDAKAGESFVIEEFDLD